MDYSGFAFPKEGDSEPVLIRVMDGDREVINLLLAAGRTLYRTRVMQMLKRQHNRCCLEGYIKKCPGRLIPCEATFEHEDGRGGGHRDDRIELPDGTWINGAAHKLCNGIKGSRRIPYNDLNNAKIRALAAQSRASSDPHPGTPPETGMDSSQSSPPGASESPQSPSPGPA